MFNDSKYSDWYYTLMDMGRRDNTESSVYYEKHHVIPRSMGGDNSKTNIVALTPRQHYVAHLLLTKMCIDKSDRLSMIRAWWVLKHTRGQRVSNSRLFATLREEYSKAARAARIGKKHSDETRNKISANHACVKGANNPNYGKITSESTKQKIRANKRSLSGNENPMYGKTHTDEVKQLLSTHGKAKWTPEMRDKIRKARSPGVVVTPWGHFLSYREAAFSPLALFKDPATIKRRCDRNSDGYALMRSSQI